MTLLIKNHSSSFWGLQIPGWILLIYLIYAQGITAFGYDLGVSMGTQEPTEVISEVGVAFWYGFAFGDLVAYIPILLMGLIGHLRAEQWGRICVIGDRPRLCAMLLSFKDHNGNQHAQTSTAQASGSSCAPHPTG